LDVYFPDYKIIYYNIANLLFPESWLKNNNNARSVQGVAEKCS
jgi:hypothetical protein